jgi:SAM-dependent methyltransferase
LSRAAEARTGTAQRIVAGSEYARMIMTRESDRRARAVFQTLALAHSRPGDNLFDFGAGTGIDARHYAVQGRRVFAYDVDANMCEYFRVHCRDFIETGSVSIQCTSYAQFLQSTPSGLEGRIDLITSNFAPLNLIEDLGRLFARFHALTVKDGRVLVCVLSPYFIGDTRYAWWWRNLWRLWRKGQFAVQGTQAPIVRRRLAELARACRPYFELERVYRGMPGREYPRLLATRGHSMAWLPLSTCRFMLLVFRRVP